MIHCVELAVEDRGGEFLGHPVELLSADGKCSGEGGTTAALKVAADPQIVGIITQVVLEILKGQPRG